MSNFLKKIDWRACFRSYYWLLVLLIALDQGTKWLMVALEPYMVPVIPGFMYFTLTRNSGAAWSILSGNTRMLALFSLAIGVGFIVYRIYKRKQLTTIMKADIALIVGGTLGNFIDRAFYPKGVIDFISLVFGNYDFPIFNVADMSLVIGFIGLALIIVFNLDIIPPKKETIAVTEVNKTTSEEKTKDE